MKVSGVFDETLNSVDESLIVDGIMLESIDENITGTSNDVVLFLWLCDGKIVIDEIIDNVVVVVDGIIDISDDKYVGNVPVSVIELIGSFDVTDNSNSIDFVVNCDESFDDSEFNIVAFSSDVNLNVVSFVDMSFSLVVILGWKFICF